MIDVFVRVSPFNEVRIGMWLAVEARWKIAGANLKAFRPSEIAADRRWAEMDAESDPYIYTDDDVLIVGKNWIERGREAMLANPEYTVCSTLSLIEGENGAKPPDGAGVIYPMHSVGAPMWIRKGFFTEMPEMTLNSECGALYDYTLAKGKKQGLFNVGIRHMHLGHGFSSTPGLDFGM